MDLFDISTLQRDANQSNLYDLTAPTFTFQNPATLEYTVLPEEEMRMDLISNTIYGTDNYVDLLMNLNGLDNPLNVMSGDKLLFISLDQLNSYQETPSINTQQRNTLLNSNKQTSTSSTRQAYTTNNYSLPPTFLQTPASPIVISNGNITITPIL